MSTRALAFSILAAAMACLIASAGLAQTPTWKIYKPTNTGLQGNYAYSILFDSAGTLWAAANDPVWDEGGLASFDGTRWRNWSTVDGTSPSFELSSLKRDSQGNLWAASPAGLLKFDGQTWTVYNTSNSPLLTNFVRDVAIDGAGNIWVAMNDFNHNIGGLGKFDGASWTIYTRQNGIPWPSPYNGVECVAAGPGNVIYIGSDVVGAARFDGVSWTWYDPNGPNHPPSNWIGDIVVEPGGTAWFSSPTGGIGRLSGSTWSYYSPPGTNGVSGLTLGNGGDLWVGTYSMGVWRFNTGSWTGYGWPGSHVYSIALDPDGVLWAAGIGGVARYLAGQWTQYDVANTGLTERFINGIGFENQGSPWISTAGGGICRFDGTLWTDFNPYNHGARPWPFLTDATDCALDPGDGTIWVGTVNQGVGIWDGSAWTQQLPGLEIYALCKDTGGGIWASWDGQVGRWNGTSWQTFSSSDCPGIFGEMHGLAADGHGGVWAGGRIGLCYYDGTQWTDYSSHLIFPPYVSGIAVSPDGTVWVGTQQGLVRYDGSTWTFFDQNSTPLPASVITAVSVTSDNVVWVGCFDGGNYPYPGGVGRFDGTTWTIYTTQNSPLPHNQVWALRVAPDDRIWIGTASQGVAVITETNPAGAEGDVAAGPKLSLGVRPNPLAGEALLSFVLPQPGRASLLLFDAAGRRTATVLDRDLSAGFHAVHLDGRSLSPGVYFYKLNTGSGTAGGRLVVVR